jgi:hypothetical protein
VLLAPATVSCMEALVLGPGTGPLLLLLLLLLLSTLL